MAKLVAAMVTKIGSLISVLFVAEKEVVDL